MKIKTKKLSYDEVMALPRPEHEKPKKPSKLLAAVARTALKGELKQTDFTYEYQDMDKAGDGPWLILMNHSSFTDLAIAFEILKDRPFSIVCTSDALVGKKSLMRNLGCIPTRKFVSDMTLIADMDHAIRKNNASVLMYPEAGYSLDGTTTVLPRHMGVLFRRLKVPVVMITAYGAFTRDPLYNNLQKRKVKVSATVRCLFSIDDLKTMKSDELDEKLEEAFRLDYFKWQKDNGIKVTEAFRADGLHRILYKCPHCLTEGKTVGQGTTLRCSGCGVEYEMDELGAISAKNAESKFTHIPDWFAWEREQTKQEITDGTYLLDTECDIAILQDNKALYMVGTGTLRHDNNGFVIDGCDGKLHYEQKPRASYSLYSDYYWYEIGDMICIGDMKTLYYCFPKAAGDIVAKARIATEELYKRNA